MLWLSFRLLFYVGQVWIGIEKRDVVERDATRQDVYSPMETRCRGRTEGRREMGRFTCKKYTYWDHQSRPTWVGSRRAPSLLLCFFSNFFSCFY